MKFLTFKVNRKTIIFLNIIIANILSFTFNSDCNAKITESNIITFLSPSIGLGSSGISINSLLFLGIQRSNKILGLSYRYIYSEKLHGDWFFGGGSIDKLLDRSAIISFGFKKRNSIFLTGIGISRINFRKRYSQSKENIKMGFPLEFRVFTRVNKLYGIGVSFFGNLNKIKSYFGAGINLSVGLF